MFEENTEHRPEPSRAPKEYRGHVTMAHPARRAIGSPYVAKKPGAV